MAPAITRGSAVQLAMLWLAGNALRVTILAVPPVLPQIHRSLHLTEAAVGALTALPVLLLSAGAVFGSLLVARLGARRALLAGMLLVAISGGLRGVGSNAAILFVMTLLMGAGVAISQPTLPALVRRWFPDATGPATAAYANGLLVGEIVAAALTVPLVLPLVGHNWGFALLFWSVAAGVIAVLFALTTRHEPRALGMAPIRWWPDWGSGRTWRLGFVLGGASLAYFGVNAFLPDFLKATHHAGLLDAALTSINLCQFPSSVLAALFAGSLVGRRWPLVLAGVVTLLSTLGFLLGGLWVVVFAGTLGFSTALVLVLTLALPPLMAGEDDVHHLTAAMFTISYACPFLGSLLGGALWDSTGIAFVAFLPVLAAGLWMALLAGTLDLSALRLPPATRRSEVVAAGDVR